MELSLSYLEYFSFPKQNCTTQKYCENLLLQILKYSSNLYKGAGGRGDGAGRADLARRGGGAGVRAAVPGGRGGRPLRPPHRRHRHAGRRGREPHQAGHRPGGQRQHAVNCSSV